MFVLQNAPVVQWRLSINVEDLDNPLEFEILLVVKQLESEYLAKVFLKTNLFRILLCCDYVMLMLLLDSNAKEQDTCFSESIWIFWRTSMTVPLKTGSFCNLES